MLSPEKNDNKLLEYANQFLIALFFMVFYGFLSSYYISDCSCEFPLFIGSILVSLSLYVIAEDINIFFYIFLVVAIYAVQNLLDEQSLGSGDTAFIILSLISTIMFIVLIFSLWHIREITNLKILFISIGISGSLIILTTTSRIFS